MRSIAYLRCGDRVCETDGRHVARVDHIERANGRALFAKLRWEGTLWISERVDVRGLEYAPEDC